MFKAGIQRARRGVGDDNPPASDSKEQCLQLHMEWISSILVGMDDIITILTGLRCKVTIKLNLHCFEQIILSCPHRDICSSVTFLYHFRVDTGI